MKTEMYNSNDSIPIVKSITLEKIKVALSKVVHPTIIDNMKLDFREDVLSRQFIFDLKTFMMGQHLEDIEKSYPVDWWQAFKERWFPKWWLEQWPVQYNKIHIRVDALYPKIELPDEINFLNIQVMEWRTDEKGSK
jgi:hypothetical protein